MHSPFHEFALAETVLPSGEVSVAAAGDLDLSTVPQLQMTLRRLAQHRRRTRLDLSRATFIESAVLAVIIRATRDAARDHWSFRLAPQPSGVVLRLFELTGVSYLLEPAGLPARTPRQARFAMSGPRDVAAEERARDAMRRMSREYALDERHGRDRAGTAVRARRDALRERQAAAADRWASDHDRHSI